MSSPCTHCTKGCCHHYIVTVTGYDAWVIAKGLGLALEQFLVPVPQSTPNARGFFLDQTGQTFDIALDKSPAQTPEKPCVFWIGLAGGIGRCGIYSLRPDVCKTYPAILGEGGVVERREDVLCASDTWRDGTLKQPIWRNRLNQMRVEFDIYELAVARWNYHLRQAPPREPVPVLVYYDYLMNFYARLDPIRAALTAVQWVALCERWSEYSIQGQRPLLSSIKELEPWEQVIHAIYNTAEGFFPSDWIVRGVVSDSLRSSQQVASAI